MQSDYTKENLYYYFAKLLQLAFINPLCKIIDIHVDQSKGEDSSTALKRNRYIPEKVRDAVWRRDEGRCVECGSKEYIEFDHIIPISKGGSNTKRNIQLLCAKCNSEKSDKI